MNRGYLAQKAHEHNEDITVRLAKETQISIAQTKMYGPEWPEFRNQRIREGQTIVQLVPRDSVSCLFNETMEGKVAILNFASFRKPGGGYLNGMSAQEECLCHESNLYPILCAFDDNYYDWNRKHFNLGLYMNRALYTPDVVFEFGEAMLADVITCAAPNFDSAHYRYGVSEAENEMAFKDRIKFMLKIAEDNHVDTLILGAWGCGVFGQNPYSTCEWINQELIYGGYGFTKVYYAIPGGSYDGNYVAFEEVINNV